MEACATSHYWGRVAQGLGRQAQPLLALRHLVERLRGAVQVLGCIQRPAQGRLHGALEAPELVVKSLGGA